MDNNLELLNIMEKMQKAMIAQDQQIQNLKTCIDLLTKIQENQNEKINFLVKVIFPK